MFPGLLFAAPLLISAVMSVAILCMFYAEHARGVAVPAAPVVFVGIVVLASLYGAVAFLREIRPGRITSRPK